MRFGYSVLEKKIPFARIKSIRSEPRFVCGGHIGKLKLKYIWENQTTRKWDFDRPAENAIPT